MSSTAKSPRATVIVATYENPKALALVFAGLARQTTRDFEVLVADDGSGSETGRLIERTMRASAVTVRHVWQPDDGLRKGRCQNRAILAAAGDYLIFLDGDCIPGPDFVAQHLELARPRAYLSGSCVLLGPERSEALSPDEVTQGALDGLRSVRAGNRRSRRLAALPVPGVSSLLDTRFAPNPVGFHGGNASVARADAIAVGGFDERLQRFEDKDFGFRLRQLGVTGASVRYRIPVWHVHHDRGYVDQRMRDDSRALFEANVAAKIARTDHGLARDAAVDADTIGG